MARRCVRPQCFYGLLLALTLFGGLIFPAFAAPPNYFIRTWQVEQGLPQNKVTAVVQSRDGYLWLGTYNGLARFDGVRFTVFDDNNTPELHSSRITSLFEAADGTLWIGTESGDVAQYKDGHFATVPLSAKWSGGKIYAITADDTGDIWLLNEAGELARPRDGKVLSPPSGLVTKVVSLTRGQDGTIWIDREGVVSALQGGRLSTVLSTTVYVQGFCAARDGGFWVACDGAIRKWKDGRWVADLGAAPWGVSIVPNFMETSSGKLVCGTPNSGLWLLSSKEPGKFTHFDRENYFPSDWVISLYEDREGNLWSGTGAGLVMIRRNNITTVSPPDQWQGRSVLSVYPGTNNVLWIGTEGAGLYRFQNGAWTNFNFTQGILNPYVWSLADDALGQLYVGTWGGGLFRQDGGVFHFAPGMTNLTPPMPALMAESNSLWVGTTEGVLHYEAGSVTWLNTARGKFSADVRAIVRDQQGALWIGTSGSGLTCVKNQTAHQFGKADGLSSDFIDCLYVANDGTLWIGTFGGGLNRFKDGHFSVINGKEGLPNNVIGDIEADSQGYFWMSSYGGIIRASEAELNQCADGNLSKVQCLTYGINDGLPTLECSEGLQPAGCRTADGHLWFPTAKGLVCIDPTMVIANSLPPPVVIEQMLVDDQPVAGPLKIPPGRHHFDFQYTGLSFVAPEKVYFQYRLKGLDKDWVNVGAKRVASYGYIPPGDYSFQVIACNDDGVWNETGASIAFSVLPYFWQTLWFRALALAALIGFSGALAWFDTRRRMHARLEKAERQRDIERERSRIARDIHDDLGSHLTRISMISESVRSELMHPERVASALDRIYDTARELTRSMDEIVWAVNPVHDTLESLSAYLEKFAQDWLMTAGIRCRLDMPIEFPEWHLTSEMRHNFFLACKEALHNVVKHSGASEVNIRLVIQQTSFELSIEDNGCGFSPEAKLPNHPGAPAGRSSGNGLKNMVRRLSEIGGNCVFESQPGKGTKVLFTVRLKPVKF